MATPLQTSVPVRPASVTASPKPRSLPSQQASVSAPAARPSLLPLSISIPEETVTLTSQASQIVLGAVVGIAAGLVVDKVLQRIQNSYKLRPLTIVLIQLVVAVIILMIMIYVLSLAFRKFLKRSDGSIAGWVFTTFFIAIQRNLFRNIKVVGNQVSPSD